MIPMPRRPIKLENSAFGREITALAVGAGEGLLRLQ